MVSLTRGPSCIYLYNCQRPQSPWNQPERGKAGAAGMVEFVVWSSVAGGRSIRVLELLQKALASSCRASQRNGFLCRIVFKGAGSQSQGGMAGGAQRSHTLSCHLERVL